jgi:hypothetical protein
MIGLLFNSITTLMSLVYKILTERTITLSNVQPILLKRVHHHLIASFETN